MEGVVYLLHPVIDDILYIGECGNPLITDASVYKCFNTDSRIVYKPFASDFGPMNLASIHQFIEIVQEEIRERKGLKVVYCFATFFYKWLVSSRVLPNYGARIYFRRRMAKIQNFRSSS